MNKSAFFLVFVGLSCCFSLSFEADKHAIYISVLELEASEMRIKVFSNDLETAIIDQTNSKFHLIESADQLLPIQQYFQQHIDLQINHQSIPTTLTHYRIENDTHWLYFEVKTPDHWQNLSLKANYLMEVFPTQSNIVQLTYQGKKQFARLSKQDAVSEFQFTSE